MSVGFAVFDTPVGSCGIAWGEAGVVRLGLPENSVEELRDRLCRGLDGAEERPPPPAIRAAIDLIVALLAGAPADLDAIVLDMRGVSDFDRRVYDVTRSVPPGRTTTYGDIARAIGDSGAAQAVGRSLGANPFPIVVPCHRVLGADGKAGGFSAHGGLDTKFRLLAIEKARRDDAPGLFDDLPLAVGPRR